jgi:MerR family transcriptional regulator, light-induced transcriptional regulator
LTPFAPEPAAPELDAVRDAYVAALMAPDTRAAWRAVEDAIAAGTEPRRIYLDVLGPAMEEVGRLWETARISVAQEHLATQVTQTVLARLAPLLSDAPPLPGARTAVVAGTPGELHAVGGRMVADFLEAAGYDVLLLGPDAPLDELVALVSERRPAVVALSTTLPGNLLAAGRVFAALRRVDGPPLLVAGGRAYDGDAARALAAGADVFATDPDDLLRELAARLA